MYREESSILGRDLILDMMKGMCVFAMAVHHCINYFPGYSLSFWRFVSGAFPFLAGYLSTSIMRERCMSMEGDRSIGTKLLIRGAKLLIICLGMNLGIRFFMPEMTKLGGDTLFRTAGLVFYSGDYRSVVFSLLIPIGYVISFSGILYLIHRNHLGILIPVTCCVGGYCSFVHFSTQTGYYFCYFAIGVLGMSCGIFHKQMVEKIKIGKYVVISLWVLSLIIITYFGQPFPIYMLYVLTSVNFCYVTSYWIKRNGKLSVFMAKHGRYSLLLYICQIVFLYFAKHIVSSMEYFCGNMGFWVSLGIVLMIQWAIVEGIHYFRGKEKKIDMLYRFIFA